MGVTGLFTITLNPPSPKETVVLHNCIIVLLHIDTQRNTPHTRMKATNMCTVEPHPTTNKWIEKQTTILPLIVVAHNIEPVQIF